VHAADPSGVVQPGCGAGAQGAAPAGRCLRRGGHARREAGPERRSHRGRGCAAPESRRGGPHRLFRRTPRSGDGFGRGLHTRPGPGQRPGRIVAGDADPCGPAGRRGRRRSAALYLAQETLVGGQFGRHPRRGARKILLDRHPQRSDGAGRRCRGCREVRRSRRQSAGAHRPVRRLDAHQRHRPRQADDVHGR